MWNQHAFFVNLCHFFTFFGVVVTLKMVKTSFLETYVMLIIRRLNSGRPMKLAQIMVMYESLQPPLGVA